MSRKSFDSFSSGLWFDEFGKALDVEFLNASGNEKATKIYNNTAYITNESEFRHVMASLAGNVYANINQREKAKLINVEEGYHKLSKPKKEKGTFRTKASVGMEVKDKHGIFLTGEYSVGEHKEDDYRAGVNLKTVF